jgi:general secretion pathway protein D
VHDTITSSVTFSAREKEYKDIMEYLTILRNNLYVIEYDIAIYDVELKDNYSLGIDWNLLSSGGKIDFSSTVSSSFGSAATSATAANFGAILNMDKLSGIITGEALTQFGKVESIQKPKLLGIAGTDVVLVDGLEEPYIKEFKTTAVGDNGVQTSTVSGSALSGLKVTLNSNVMDGTVLTDISLEINDIVGYSNFQVDGVSYAQPRTRTKNIQNTMRVQPGVPIVISGLFRHKKDKGYKGIPGLANTQAKLIGGSESDSGTKSEMVIIVTPRLIKYVMK